MTSYGWVMAVPVIIIFVFVWDARDRLKKIEGLLESIHSLSYDTWEKHASIGEIERKKERKSLNLMQVQAPLDGLSTTKSIHHYANTELDAA